MKVLSISYKLKTESRLSFVRKEKIINYLQWTRYYKNKNIKFNFLVTNNEHFKVILKWKSIEKQMCTPKYVDIEKYWGLIFIDNITAIHSG